MYNLYNLYNLLTVLRLRLYKPAQNAQPVKPAQKAQPVKPVQLSYSVAAQTPPEMQMKHYNRLCTKNAEIMTLKENMVQKQAAIRQLYLRMQELNAELANTEHTLSGLIETQVIDIKLYNSNYPDGYLVQDTKN